MNQRWRCCRKGNETWRTLAENDDRVRTMLVDIDDDDWTALSGPLEFKEWRRSQEGLEPVQCPDPFDDIVPLIHSVVVSAGRV